MAIKTVTPAKRGDALKTMTKGFAKTKSAYSTKFGSKSNGAKSA